MSGGKERGSWLSAEKVYWDPADSRRRGVHAGEEGFGLGLERVGTEWEAGPGRGGGGVSGRRGVLMRRGCGQLEGPGRTERPAPRGRAWVRAEGRGVGHPRS